MIFSVLLESFICFLIVAPSTIDCEPKFKLNPTDACTRTSPELLVWIHSATTNNKKRDAIRMTWGNPLNYDSGIYRVKAIFFVGFPPTSAKELNSTVSPSRIQSRLEYEQEVYGDLVQGEFIDTYRNMTYKAVHSLRWISTYCSNARFIMKVDDDILVNIFKLLPFLRLRQYKQYYPSNTISCNLWSNREPIRDPESKWYISRKDYPRNIYPPFCQGMVYFITPDLASRLYNASFTITYISMDDVYITGLLPNKLSNPKVEFKKLSSEYAGVYGVGKRVVNYVKKNAKSVTFVHTEHIDSFFLSWCIFSDAYRGWNINSLI